MPAPAGAAKPWPRGNYVRIFVTQVLDIWAQAEQCCVSARGWRAHNQEKIDQEDCQLRVRVRR